MIGLRRDFIYIGVILILIGVLIWTTVSIRPQTPQSVVTPAYDADAEIYDWEITEFATDLEVPWDMAFIPSGELFITERPGRVKLRQTNGEIKTIATLPVAATGESGLTGLALDPKFSDTRAVYLYYTLRKGGDIFNRVSRFTYKDGTLKDEKVIVDNLPGGSIHNGGRIRFGPDGKLWIPTGDAAEPSQAQNLTALGGKILRLNDDGSIPSDNPFPSSAVYSYGHRNPQGLAWQPLTEELLATEHGETAHDEVNIIQAKHNYGWPTVKKCTNDDVALTAPIVCSGEQTWAPSGIAALGTKIWRFRYSLVLAGLRGNLLKRIAVVDGRLTEQEDIIAGQYGRLRAVITDGDGAVYVSTSNKDGRGSPKPGDDKILKLTPVKK